MYLTKNGVTVEVDHPADIRRYKSLGYAEEPAPAAPKAEVPAPEKTNKRHTTAGKKQDAEAEAEKDGE